MEPDNIDRIPLTHLTSYHSYQHSRSSSKAPSEYSRLENEDDLQTRSFHQNKSHVAVRASRNLPLLQWLTHGTSVLFTIALLVLCGKNVYFADITRPGINSTLNAFQFVARFHEIVIGASVTMMVVHQLRYELCTTPGVPLGFVAHAYSLAQPQILFTKEFWVAFFAQTGSRRKHLFGIIIFLGTVLIALSGPSSAILVVPQLGWWELKEPFTSSPVNGFSWLDSSYDDLFPTFIDRSWLPGNETFLDCVLNNTRMDSRCPYASSVQLGLWASDYVSQWAPPNVTIYTGAGMLRYLTASNISGEQGLRGYTVASTGMADLTRDIGTLWLYASRENLRMTRPGRPVLSLQSTDSSKPLMKPLVQVQCAMPVDITHNSLDKVGMTFPTSELIGKNRKSLDFPPVTVDVDPAPYSDSEDNKPVADYIDLSEQAGRHLIGVLVGMQFASPWYIFPDGGYNEGDNARGLIACTIIPNWVPTTLSRDVRTDNVLVLDNADPAHIVQNSALMSKAQEIEIDIGWAVGANSPEMGDTGLSSVLAYQVGYLTFEDNLFDGNWTTRWPWLMSSMISMTWAEGLARLNYDKPLYVWAENEQNSTESFAWNIVDLNINFLHPRWQNPSEESIADFISSQPDKYHPVRWTVARFGYAWGFERATKYLAAVVILSHIVWVLVHLAMVPIRRWRCDSWNTMTKLMVLAVQSPPSRYLEGTSTSIDDRSTYADVVRIRESKDKDGRRAVLDVTTVRQIDRHNPFIGPEEGHLDLYPGGESRLRIGKKYM